MVLRQPTRKQRVISEVWGRAIFYFETGKYSGSAIVLEAQQLAPIKWMRSLTPEQQQELKRLSSDGHTLHHTRRHIEIHPTPDSLRNTQLYRTLLHELGHLVDFSRYSPEEWNTRTFKEKEDYAHRYANETFKHLQEGGHLPFPPQLNAGELQRDGIEPSWFSPSHSSNIPVHETDELYPGRLVKTPESLDPNQ